MKNFKDGEIVSLVFGKIKMIVTGCGSKDSEFKDHVHVCWEQNDRVETMFLPEKCLKHVDIKPEQTGA